MNSTALLLILPTLWCSLTQDQSREAGLPLQEPAKKEPASEQPRGFPRVELLPGLVQAPYKLPERFSWSADAADFLTWFDGTPSLFFGQEKDFSVCGSDFHVRDTLHTSRNFHRVLTVPQESHIDRLFVLAQDGLHGGPKYAMALDREGNELWFQDSQELEVKDWAVLRDEKGPYGLALGFGGATGIQAVGLEGATLWQLPFEWVLYELRTHPRLPGLLLVVDGLFDLIPHDRALSTIQRAESDNWRSKKPGGFYVTHGELFPDEQGEPGMVLAGPGKDVLKSRREQKVLGSLARVDRDKNVQWIVDFDSTPSGLAMLEPEGRERLFALALRQGSLVLFNEQGTLRWKADLPTIEVDFFADTGQLHDGKVHIYFLRAGQLDEGCWALAVRSLDGIYVYRMNVDLLAESK